MIRSLFVLCLVVGCGGSRNDETAATSSLTQMEAGVGGSGSGNGSPVLPASYAGESSTSGPGLPFDFVGTVTTSLPLTAAEQAAVARANLLSKTRNPPSQSKLDRGFGGGPAFDSAVQPQAGHGGKRGKRSGGAP